MSRTIIVGPQGCGKTKNAQRLAKMFGHTVIVDGWDGMAKLPEGCLALTNTVPLYSDHDVSLIWDYEVAMSRLAEQELPA